MVNSLFGAGPLLAIMIGAAIGGGLFLLVVALRGLPPKAPSGRFHGPADYRRRFPDGRIGSNPGLATPEKGKRFFETAVPELVKTYNGFVGENA